MFSERGAAWLARGTGGAEVGGSNPLAPTSTYAKINNIIKNYFNEICNFFDHISLDCSF